MKREDLKQLAIEAGFDVTGVQGFLVATGIEGTQDHKLRKLISLVEQATLERAAKVCDDHAESYANSATAIDEGGDDAHSVWAMATASKFAGAKIRALKDSND